MWFFGAGWSVGWLITWLVSRWSNSSKGFPELFFVNCSLLVGEWQSKLLDAYAATVGIPVTLLLTLLVMFMINRRLPPWNTYHYHIAEIWTFSCSPSLWINIFMLLKYLGTHLFRTLIGWWWPSCADQLAPELVATNDGQSNPTVDSYSSSTLITNLFQKSSHLKGEWFMGGWWL